MMLPNENDDVDCLNSISMYLVLWIVASTYFSVLIASL